MAKVAIFPASGGLGTSIYTHLLDMIDPKQVILISRHPDKIPSKYTERGVITRKANYDDPGSLQNVFNDVSVLVLISYPSIEYEHRFKAHKAAIDAAVASKPGVSHVIYTSLAFGGDCTPVSVAQVMQAHLATESYLRTVGLRSEKALTFTAIREGLYSESFPLYTGFFDLGNPPSKVKMPHDGSGPGIAWAKREELGEASARIVEKYLQAPKEFEFLNEVMLLSGPKTWDIAETLDALGKVAGRTANIAQVGIEEYVNDSKTQAVLGSHGPDDPARDWATTFEAVNRGETAVASGNLERLLGRRPEDFAETVKALASKH